MLTDNLLGVAQNFASPDIVKMFSSSINEPIEKTKAGLKSIIPTLLMGIVNKGSTTKGAETLVNMVKTQNFETATAPNENNLRQGDDVVNNIFGGNLSSIVSKLGTTTGLNSGSITKMLGLAAPMIMGVLGSKVKSEGLTPSSLKSFLGSQKGALIGLVPAGLPSLSGITKKFTPNPDLADKKSWKKLAFLILLAFGALVWLTGRNIKKDIVTEPTAMVTPLPESIPLASSATTTSAMSELTSFIQTATISDLPKTFKFENLVFESGTSTIVEGSETELEIISNALIQSPQATVRIEGFANSSEITTINEDVAFRRAVAVKEYLVGKGVNPDRIDTVSEQNQIASMELTVTGI